MIFLFLGYKSYNLIDNGQLRNILIYMLSEIQVNQLIEENELLQEVGKLLRALPAETIENDPVLAKEVAQLLNYKLGLDRKSYERLFGEFAAKRKQYQHLFKAIEEEVVGRNSLGSFKI